MTIIQKIKGIVAAIPNYCNKQKIKELFDESARVSHNYLMNQISYIDSNPNINPVMKEIYKADLIRRTVSGLCEGEF